eukprot:5581695-Pyramimonas_sp.AAC.1
MCIRDSFRDLVVSALQHVVEVTFDQMHALPTPRQDIFTSHENFGQPSRNFTSSRGGVDQQPEVEEVGRAL